MPSQSLGLASSNSLQHLAACDCTLQSVWGCWWRRQAGPLRQSKVWQGLQGAFLVAFLCCPAMSAEKETGDGSGVNFPPSLLVDNWQSPPPPPPPALAASAALPWSADRRLLQGSAAASASASAATAQIGAQTDACARSSMPVASPPSLALLPFHRQPAASSLCRRCPCLCSRGGRHRWQCRSSCPERRICPGSRTTDPGCRLCHCISGGSRRGGWGM